MNLRKLTSVKRTDVRFMAIGVVACGIVSADAPLSDRDSVQALASIGDSTAVVLAAGDIAACTRGSWLTARLLDKQGGDILIAGDAAYITPTDPNPYRTCFDTTWGRHKTRIHPVPGNHDQDPNGMRRYFEYFGASAGPQPGGYYSFDVGDWHVLALNSTIAMDSSSAQGKWVAADLAANPRQCTLVFMHHPRFSSGPHEKSPAVIAVFPVLDAAGVHVAIAAHDHIYERFAPMRANGVRDDRRGIRQFVVGTGGNTLYGIRNVQPNSQIRQNSHVGILKLTLHQRGYVWEFLSGAPSSFRDRGTGTCH
ncbi:MAG: metallophosphoesterase [Gemmatimonadaceae bacterium]